MGQKIRVKFSKNHLLAEYFKEEFELEDEVELPDQATAHEASLAKLILMNNQQKLVYYNLKMQGYITNDLYLSKKEELDKSETAYINYVEKNICRKVLEEILKLRVR